MATQYKITFNDTTLNLVVPHGQTATVCLAAPPAPTIGLAAEGAKGEESAREQPQYSYEAGCSAPPDTAGHDGHGVCAAENGNISVLGKADLVGTGAAETTLHASPAGGHIMGELAPPMDGIAPHSKQVAVESGHTSWEPPHEHARSSDHQELAISVDANSCEVNHSDIPRKPKVSFQVQDELAVKAGNARQRRKLKRAEEFANPWVSPSDDEANEIVQQNGQFSSSSQVCRRFRAQELPQGISVPPDLAVPVEKLTDEFIAKLQDAGWFEVDDGINDVMSSGVQC